MSYVIELERESCHLAYIVAQADTVEDARAIIDGGAVALAPGVGNPRGVAVRARALSFGPKRV